MVDLVQVIQWVVIAFAIGIIAPIGFIKYKRSYYQGKVYCYFYQKNRELDKKFITPNKRGLLEWNNGYYVYKEDNIVIDKHTLAGKISTLSYIENNPLPTNHMSEYTSDELGFTARQLKSDFEDNAMASFAEATDVNISEMVVARVRKDFIIMFLALAGLVAGIGFFLFDKGSV